MITVSMNDLINSTETLQKLAQKDFKAKLAWSVARLLKGAETEISGFNDARMNLIKKYGEKDEAGELITDDKGNCKIEPDNIGAFTSELDEILKSTVEINANKIDFCLLENEDFTPADMANLEPFVDFNDE